MMSFQGQFMNQCNNLQSIYLMECNNQYKIGISNNPKKRYHTFLTGNPSIKMICYSKPVSFATTLEIKLHHLFKNKNIRGEWFSLSDENISTLIKLLSNLSENDFYIIENMNI